MSSKLFALIGFVSFLLVAPAFATITYVGSQAGLGADSSTNWSALGADQALVGQTFSNGGVNGSFATSGGGYISVVGTSFPAATGFTSGDHLLVSEDTSGVGSGPLTLLLGTSKNALGAYLEINSLATFTAQIVALGSGGTVLGSGTFTNTSDGSGNPLFMGVSDSVAGQLFGIQLSITACTPLAGNLAGCSTTDFATDTLFIQSAASGVPESGSMLLVGIGFLALGGLGRWRYSGIRRATTDAR